MANKYVDLNTVKFFMNNVQELESILSKKRFADHNLESVDMFIDSVKQFADRELFPYFKEMDENPAHYNCLLYTSPSPRDATLSRMPSSA